MEEDLLLKYLIKRGEQALSGKPPKHTSPWWSFAAAAVHFDERLGERFKRVWDSATRMAVSETLVLLREAQQSLPENMPVSDVPEVDDDRQPLSGKEYRQILWYAWKEGRRLLDSAEFEFLPVWSLVSWIALQGFPKHLKQFVEITQSDLPPEELLDQGHNIVRDCLFGGESEDLDD